MITGNTRRWIVWASLGASTTLLVVVGGFWALTVVRTQRVVAQYKGSESDWGAASAKASARAIVALGGPRKAVLRIDQYLDLPDWVAKDKFLAVRLLGACGDIAVPRLITLLRCGQFRSSACLALSEIGPDAKDAVPELLVLLGSNDGEIPLFAINALQSIGAAAAPALPSLDKLAASSDPEMSDAAHHAADTIRKSMAKGVEVQGK